MFDNLSEKLQGVFKKLKGHGKLNEGDIKAALREVKLALLEGDVHFKVVKDFIDAIHSRAMRLASAIWSGVMRLATKSRFSCAFS